MSIIRVENKKIDSYPEELRAKLRVVWPNADATDTLSHLRYMLERCGTKAEGLIVRELSLKVCSGGSFEIVRDDFLEEYLIKVRRHDVTVEELELAFILAINSAYQKLRLVEDNMVYIEALGLHLQSDSDIDQVRRRFAKIEDKAEGMGTTIQSIQGGAEDLKKLLSDIEPAFRIYEEGIFLDVRAMPSEVTQELSDIKQQLLELQEGLAKVTKRVVDGPVQG
jgi:hypothetical protein